MVPVLELDLVRVLDQVQVLDQVRVLDQVLVLDQVRVLDLFLEEDESPGYLQQYMHIKLPTNKNISEEDCMCILGVMILLIQLSSITSYSANLSKSPIIE